MANIILDYDGTIHDSRHIYVPAFREGVKHLTDNGLAPLCEYSDEEIAGYLGYSAQETWELFMPELEQRYRDESTKIVGAYMHKLTSEGKSVLYDGALKQLSRLKNSGHTLIFLSNCMHDYMEAHRKAHNLNCFYSAFYCTEDFGFKSKPEIFAEIEKQYGGEFIVVGDRCLDLEVAKRHGLKSVGCLYGYCKDGELDEATVKIKYANELSWAVEKICRSEVDVNGK